MDVADDRALRHFEALGAAQRLEPGGRHDVVVNVDPRARALTSGQTCAARGERHAAERHEATEHAAASGMGTAAGA